MPSYTVNSQQDIEAARRALAAYTKSQQEETAMQCALLVGMGFTFIFFTLFFYSIKFAACSVQP